MADRGACGKKVAKSAKTLACDFCRLWYHMSCTWLTDSDYNFMKVERGLVFVGFVGSALVALMVPWEVIVQRIRWMKSYPTLLLQWRELTEDWETWRLELVLLETRAL